MLRLHHAAILLALCTSLTAQSFFVPDNNPAAGSCNVIPFGHTGSATWANQRYQQMVLTSDLGSIQAGTICDLAFAPCTFGVRHFDTIEIVLAQTTATRLSNTFATNLATNPQVVLKATDYDWDNSTANVWTRIGLDTPYLYLASRGNLVVQITVTGARLVTTSTAFPGYHTGARERLYAFNWTGAPPASGSRSNGSAQKIEVLFSMNDLQEFGVGCRGSNSQVPALTLSGSAKLGGSLAMELANALPTTVLFHNLALKRNEPRVDLGIAGAPGCYLYAPVTVLLPGVTDRSGNYGLKVQVPNNSNLLCTQLFTQMFPRDNQANAFGLTATNYGRILIGN